MVDEIEENEYEQYLIEKISLGICQSGEPQNLVTKLYSFEDEFRSLLHHLKTKQNPTAGDLSSIRRGNLYSLNNLVTEWQITKKHSSFSSKEVYDVCENIKKRLKKIKNEINGGESSSKGDLDGSVSVHQERDHQTFDRHKKEVYRWSSRFAPRKVHGIEHRVLAMERELVLRNNDAPLKMFGVVGAAGIGKTTLCQTIFGQNLVKERFSPRIWVCLSKQQKDRMDYREEIVVRILKCLGLEDEAINDAENHGCKGLILLLRLQLIGKRYLIVLDDAWNDNKFFHTLTQLGRLDDELAYGLPKGCGGAVISSSTSEALLKKMLGKDVNLQYLEPFTDKIIYEIFKDAVTGYDEDEREFHKDLDLLKDELLKKCVGIPFAAKLLAKIAWKQLDIKPKSQQTPKDGDDSSHGIKQAPAGGHEQLIDGDSGLPPVEHDQKG